LTVVYPTAVTLSSFTAEAGEGAVFLGWETATEIDNLGFNLYRAESVGGPRMQLNGALIPNKTPGSPVGATYGFLDGSVEAGVTYRYWLEDLDIYGKATQHGPVAGRPLSGGVYRVFLPLVRR
jgi:hypothetical protein